MKQYRLKQWYPRIPVYLEDGYVISFDDDKGIATYTFENGSTDTFEMSGAELECIQYWELIEEEKPKPLFITEDGVEVFDRDVDVFTTNSSFNKYRFKAKRIKDSGLNHKIFYHESNLYNYIWRNKPVFSYEDFMRWGNVPYERVIRELAMVRSGQA